MFPVSKFKGICFTFKRCFSRAGMNNRTRDVFCTLARADSALSYLLLSGLVSGVSIPTCTGSTDADGSCWASQRSHGVVCSSTGEWTSFDKPSRSLQVHRWAQGRQGSGSKAHSCTLPDCTKQNFSPRLDPSTPTLDCWWRETCCLLSRVSFPVVSSG